MALTDLLSSLIGQGGGNGGLGFGQTAGAVDPGQATGPGAQAATPLDELLVQSKGGPPKPGAPITMNAPPSDPNMAPPPPDVQPQGPVAQLSNGPSLNYNNSDDVQAVHQSLMNNQPQPGGMTSPGLYGLLPQNLQHGTLRGILGALGDSLLVSGGKAPEYANSQARQQLGNAMAGVDINNPDSVRAAASRVAATGVPGAADMADKLTQQAETAALRKATMENTNLFHQSTIDARHESLYNRMAPMAQADLAQAKDATDYAARKALWDKRIQAIDPNEDSGSALGIPDQFGQPGGLTSMSGMTNTQINQHQDRLSGQDVSTQNNMRNNATSRRDTDVNAGSRVQSARISASSRPQTEAGVEQYITDRITAAQNGTGPPLTPGEKDWANKHLSPTRGQRQLFPNTDSGPAPVTRAQLNTLGPNATNGSGRSQFQNGQVYTDAHGNHATYMNGKWIPH